MTPKEKAIELYERYYYTFPPFDGEGEFEHNLSKKCAFICVSEIINALRKDLPEIGQGKGYWSEVKKEIQKL